MPTRHALFFASAIGLAACGTEVTPPAHGQGGESLFAAGAAEGLVVRRIPDEDPGPPFYARVGLQYLHDGGLLAIPVYRGPECIPADFDLARFYDFPTGPQDPGAFACPLNMTGLLLTEPTAPQGTFPRQVVLEGDAVPFLLVDHAAFMAAAQDGITVAELMTLDPLWGTATRYHETLQPREENHKIIIEARGALQDGRAFGLHVTQIGDALPKVRIVLR